MTMLFTPGPVKLTEEIIQAQAKQMVSHREKRWNVIHMDLVNRFKKYTNAHEAYLVTGSGTLGIEMNIVNCVQRNDKMLCLANGEFGNRFVKMNEVYCNNVESHSNEPGKGWKLERCKELIDDSKADVFGMVYNETSCGTLNHVEEICKYAKKQGMRTIIDGVSAWPAAEVDIKKMNIDFFSTGSQKAIAAPPGIAMLAISEEGAKFNEKLETVPAWYMDMRKHRKFVNKKEQTPYTPAVSVYYGLAAAFDLMDKEGGPKASLERHKKGAEYTHRWAEKQGLKVVTEPEFRSNTITALWVDGGKAVKKQMREQFDIEIATGMSEWKDKMIRICHIGNFTMEELEKVLGCLEKILK